MANNETIADIIAEMRQGMNPNGTAECQYLESDICMLADRLEAAIKRERGDCAKLREALVEIREAMIRDSGAGPCTEFHTKVDTITQAALAAPPRNCDKYPTFNDAIRALADKRGWHDAKWDSERYCILASWLLAPAAEKEGGAK